MDPITPQPQNLATPELPPHKHFLNKKFIVTFVVLLLLGSGAYAGIWYWQNQNWSISAANEIKDFESCFRYVHGYTKILVSKCTAPDGTMYDNPSWSGQNLTGTTDWKTYTNTKYGYQFNYPANVSVEAVNAKSSWPATGKDDAVFVSGLMDITLVNALGKCSDLRTEQAIITCLGSVSWAKVDRWIPVTIDGLPAVRREIALKPSPAIGSDIAPVGYTYYVNNNNIGFQISAPDSPSQQLLFNQILATFKFTK